MYLRKQVNQLGSKMRFVAAQFNAALDDGNWLRWASHANSMAQRLYSGAVEVIGTDAITPPQVNSVFPVVAPTVAERLRDWCFFWEWDASTSQQRWMTAWDTTETDVDAFINGLKAALSSSSEIGD